MYWGVFDASRHAKFAWTGPVYDPNYWKLAGIALLLGLLLSLPLLARGHATVGETLTLAIAANAVGAWFAFVFGFWQTHYFVLGAAFALGLGLVLLIPLVLIALARIEEIAAIVFGKGPAAADRRPPARARRLPAEGVGPRSGASRAAGDAQGDARRAGAARLSEFRVRDRHQQHARSGVLAADRGSLPRARRAVQVHQRGQTSRATRRARCGLRSRTPRPTPRSSASSTPTTSCNPTGSRTWCRHSPTPRSAWCRRRRIIATANAARCTPP